MSRKEISVAARASSRREHSRRINADRECLPEVCDVVREAASESGFDERTNHACQLAVCEAVENIILHGYGGGNTGEIVLKVEAQPGRLTVEVVDDAPAFDPTQYKVDPDVSLSDPPVGGRGLIMMRGVMDDIRYERQGAKNVLRLTKNRAFTGA